MKKKQLTANQVMKIKNNFAPEGQAAADAIIEAIEAMAAEENENGVEDIEARVNEIIAGLKEVPAPVQEAIQNTIDAKLKTIKNLTAKQGISDAIRHEAAKAIVNSHSAEEVRESLKAVAVKNGISGLTFADVIDYEIADKFGDENELFAKLHKSEITKFFYTEATMATATAIAKQHTKGVAKDVQALSTEGKTMTPKMVYKRQQIDVEDLLRLKKAGRELALLSWVTAELRRVLTNTEVMAILIGDTVNPSGKRVTSFETIAKSATDLFTYVATAAGALATVEEVRAASDELYNPNGYEVVAVMSKAQLTALAAYTYAAGGDVHYRSKEEVAGQLGVDTIYTTDLMKGKGVILLIPEEYYVHNEGEVEVAYDVWENNQHNLQYERLDCGAIHGLLSTAYIAPAAS